jgi:polar amino acid transport system substrate-binding protein
MANPLPTLKRAAQRLATPHWLYFLMTIHATVAAAQTADMVPRFRHAESAPAATTAPPASLRLLADADFPPFSYATGSGGAAGLSVDLALFACTELKISCSVELKPFHQLLPALLRNEGDVVISAMKVDDQLMANATMTRPYFWSFGRFAAKASSPLKASDVAALAGKRLGYVKGTAHGAWIEAYYADAELMPFNSEKEMLTALQVDKLDAVFGDNLRLLFWLKGNSADGCCKALGAPYVDRAYFSRNLAFVLRRGDEATRRALDQGLDRLQDKNVASEVMARYLPPEFW